MLELSAPQPRTGNAIRLYHQFGLGSTQFARRYYGCRCCFPFLPGTEMFQFPEFPLPLLCVQSGVPTHDGWWVSPFRYPRIKALSAAPRGFSQPHTSFIGAMCQGIHRWLFVAWNSKMLVLAMQFSRNEGCRLELGAAAGCTKQRAGAWSTTGVPVVGQKLARPPKWPGRTPSEQKRGTARSDQAARKYVSDQLDVLTLSGGWTP